MTNKKKEGRNGSKSNDNPHSWADGHEEFLEMARLTGAYTKGEVGKKLGVTVDQVGCYFISTQPSKEEKGNDFVKNEFAMNRRAHIDAQKEAGLWESRSKDNKGKIGKAQTIVLENKDNELDLETAINQIGGNGRKATKDLEKKLNGGNEELSDSEIVDRYGLNDEYSADVRPLRHHTIEDNDYSTRDLESELSDSEIADRYGLNETFEEGINPEDFATYTDTPRTDEGIAGEDNSEGNTFYDNRSSNRGSQNARPRGRSERRDQGPVDVDFEEVPGEENVGDSYSGNGRGGRNNGGSEGLNDDDNRPNNEENNNGERRMPGSRLTRNLGKVATVALVGAGLWFGGTYFGKNDEKTSMASKPEYAGAELDEVGITGAIPKASDLEEKTVEAPVFEETRNKEYNPLVFEGVIEGDQIKYFEFENGVKKMETIRADGRRYSFVDNGGTSIGYEASEPTLLTDDRLDFTTTKSNTGRLQTYSRSEDGNVHTSKGRKFLKNFESWDNYYNEARKIIRETLRDASDI